MSKAADVKKKKDKECEDKRVYPPSMIDGFKLVDEYIDGSDWRVNENSNQSYSLHGLSNFISNSVQSKYWLYEVYPENIREAHLNADLHIHDLHLLSTYCCGWDLKDFLIRGFGGVAGFMEVSPPKHLDSALNQLIYELYTLRHEAQGAQAVSSLDTYMAPFIRYDNLSYKQVKQKIQTFIYGMNLPVDKGFQVPFTNVTMDIKPEGELAEEHVIIGGKVMPEQYKDFQKEILMFNKAFAEVMMRGDSNGRVFSWPIPTYNITKDFPWDEPELEAIWEMTAKYGIPYFSNFINSDMNPDDVRSMCCRLRIDNRELKKRGGGLFGSNPLTGSIGVVTVNISRLGFKHKGNKDEFYKALREVMDLAKDSLVIKRGVIEELTDRGLYPYSRHYLDGIKKRFGGYWKNHFNTIGLLGMSDGAVNFMDKDISTPEGKEFSEEVLDYMRDVLMEYQDETGEIFNLEATPGESTAYRFAKTDKKEFGDDIKVSNEEAYQNGAPPYYTNSTQLPIGFTDDIFEALDHQDDLQTKYTGGTVVHLFIGERINDIETTKKLVKTVAEKYKLPYYSITPTFSVCPTHGYLKGEHEFCPKCDQEIGWNEKYVKKEEKA
jgi:ribonucleoside-triphosphate reductase (formate)